LLVQLNFIFAYKIPSFTRTIFYGILVHCRRTKTIAYVEIKNIVPDNTGVCYSNNHTLASNATNDYGTPYGVAESCVGWVVVDLE